MAKPDRLGLRPDLPGYTTRYYQMFPDKRSQHRKRPQSKYKYDRRTYWINKYKTAKGCSECGYNKHPSALDWDHLEGFDKEFNIGTRVLNTKLSKLFREIRKCQILCANCHRIKSHLDRNAKRDNHFRYVASKRRTT